MSIGLTLRAKLKRSSDLVTKLIPLKKPTPYRNRLFFKCHETETSRDPCTYYKKFLSDKLYPSARARWLKWLERESTDRRVRGSNPTTASQLPLARPGSPRVAWQLGTERVLQQNSARSLKQLAKLRIGHATLKPEVVHTTPDAKCSALDEPFIKIRAEFIN
ncbi:hypothetical protein CSKR_108983 [Clonorchis sinensis]|uniref:Uncharacterized protein n=1 Tax=Clonorchis sinensis TaxID=79923 RepID=A0A3R7DCI0_CLOSI|nr:hypothetical protein CSKR_108983 [Clonorchis sinensis]